MISLLYSLASTWSPLPYSLLPLDRILGAVGIALFANQSTVHSLADEQPQNRSTTFTVASSYIDCLQHKRPGLQGVFQLLDENSDGVVSVAELQRGLYKLDIDISEAQLRSLIESAAKSRAGFLRFDEFNDLYDAICKETDEEDASADINESHNLLEAFRVFDTNADGFISVSELQTVLSNLGFADCRDESFCREIVHRFDTNGDGLIDYVDFERMMLSS